MSRQKKAPEKVTLVGSCVVGAILSASSIGLFAGVTSLSTWLNQGFSQAVTAFGLASLWCCFLLIGFPIIGIVVSIAHRSLYAIKSWCAATAIAIVLNVMIGFGALYVGSLLEDLSKTSTIEQSSEQDVALDS